MPEVIAFPSVPARTPSAEVLDVAKTFDLASTIVVGRTQDGELYVAATATSGPRIAADLIEAAFRVGAIATY